MLGAVLGVCLQLAASTGATPVFVASSVFTLAWTHSIEKVRWEEDYQLQLKDGQPRLLAAQARIKGSASGMEPPPDAVLRDGWYHYQPVLATPEQLRLTRSEFTPDYDWCDEQGCRPLSALIARDGGVTLLWPCTQDQIGQPHQSLEP